MSKERFLLWMLASIFMFQAGVFGLGTYYCARDGGLQSCPDLGKRYEQTFKRDDCNYASIINRKCD